jgi:predicted unusual protein kinase regulating ubiquinone biosynthesis (AarF/ABC1/UbiB family)
MLTPANAQRLAGRLSQMRGAVMKVGQLMSMDGHGVLPPHFAELLGGLRDQAHTMPATQLAEVLEREYGADWHRRFRRFSFEPIAAASIGQVHRAETHDGQVLALKIQYPGVKASIDSDVANLALLARTPGLVPKALDPAAQLARVREQLHLETDYIAEARNASEYRRRLGDDPVLTVPAVWPEHSTAHILATDFAPGVPVDQLTRPGVPQAQRDHVAAALSRLSVHEFFRMRLVQTDPNFGNYLYDAATGRVALIDFGATEAVGDARVEQLRELGGALRDADVARLTAAALAAGFIAAEDPPAQARGVIEILLLAGEPLQQRGPYDFGRSDLFVRILALGQAQYLGEGYARSTPPDLIFLQRKFIGSFMLCARLGARLDLNEIFGPEL